MNTKKACIKLDGTIGEKDQPAIEYVDKNHNARLDVQKKQLDNLIAAMKINSGFGDKKGDKGTDRDIDGE